MTTIDHRPDPSVGEPAPPADTPPTSGAERHLRRVLRANAASSGLFGLVGLVGAGYWSDRLGLGPVALTAAIAVGLVVFALDVWWIAGLPVARLRRWALTVSVADLAWVAASIVAVSVGALTTFGAVAALIVAVLVADFALTQLWFRHRLAGD